MYTTGYSSSSSISDDQVAAIIATVMGMYVGIWIIAIALAILVLVAKWKLFKKAGVDAWEALIPVHNSIVELKLGGVKTYIYFLNLIMILGVGPLIFLFWKDIMLAKSFGKGAGFGVLLALLPWIGYPILAFGKAEYIGPQE